MSDDYITINVPSKLVRKTKNPKNFTLSFQYPKSPNGYACLLAPSEDFTKSTENSCQLRLYTDRKYSLSYRDNNGKWRSNWMSAQDVQHCYDDSMPKVVYDETDYQNNTVLDLNTQEFPF